MRNFPGTPGTFLGLFLRMAQFTFAAGSVASMITTTRFFNLTAFCHLITLMGLQFIWSFTLALVDAYALVKKIFPFNPILVCRIAVGDWVTAILSLSAASASAAITVLYFHDVGHCHLGHECHKYQISVALAFMSWISTSISALIMLWLVASE
ncbi:CASP-like protein 5B3 isoform X2 [Lotus japonicus]|uniref:CASP-like protein 5B3 isoform X2 n=1 Tax=Lotus japonicus TaxID=34305 RepID=UPI002586F6B1|nr:CASP-like protein 5B3 isoform X2 [Lotus japonicus]